MLTLLMIEPGQEGLQVDTANGWVEAPARDPGNRISGTFGDNLLKARLRAHPDVAAEHHPDLVTPAAKTGP